MNGGQMILGGLLMLVVAFMLRRSFTQSKASSRRDPLREAREEIRAAETSYASAINKQEIKLHDYSREVEGRIESRITLLNRLLIEADHKIAQLEAFAEKSSSWEPRQDIPFSADNAEAQVAAEESEKSSRDGQQKIHRLADGGMSVEQIAAETSEPVSHIRLILKMRSRTSGADAA